MPKVPTFQPVRQQLIPSARVQERAPIAAFGGGAEVAGVFQAAGGLARQAEQIAVEEKRKADTQFFTDARMKTIQAKNEALFDPEKGFLRLGGKDPLEQTNQFMEDFDARADEIAGSLQNDVQRAAYSRARTNIRAEFEQKLQRHSFSERLKDEEVDFRSNLAISQDDGIRNFTDRSKVGAAIQDQESLIRDFGFNRGWNKAQIDRALQESKSRTHSGVLAQLIDNQQSTAAKEYFNQIKTNMTAIDILRIEVSLGEALIRDQSAAHAADIISKAPSRAEALDAAKEIEDGAVQAQTLKNLKTIFSAEDDSKRIRSQERLNNALATVKQTRRRPPPTEWAALSLKHQRVIDNELEHLRRGTEAVTDPQLDYRLNLLSATNPEAYKKMDLSTHFNKLNVSRRNFHINLQRGLINDDGKAKAQVRGIQSDRQIVDRIIRESGLDPNPSQKDDEKKYIIMGRLRDQIDDSIVRFLEDNPKFKRVPKAEMEKLTQDLVDFSVLNRPREFLRRGVRRFEVTIDKINSEQQRVIREGLKEAGMEESDENVVRIFKLKQINLGKNPNAD